MANPAENYLNPALGSAIPQHPRSEHTSLLHCLFFPRSLVHLCPFTPVFFPSFTSSTVGQFSPSPINQSPHTAAPPQTTSKHKCTSQRGGRKIKIPVYKC